MLGKAIDFPIDGVDLKELRDVAISLQAGGVGYYARSNSFTLILALCELGKARFSG